MVLTDERESSEGGVYSLISLFKARMAGMKYRTIKSPPPGSGSTTLKDAVNAVKEVSSNGSHGLSDDAKAALLKSGVLKLPKSVGGSALKQSHNNPTTTTRPNTSETKCCADVNL
jgi:hypothetical protein